MGQMPWDAGRLQRGNNILAEWTWLFEQDQGNRLPFRQHIFRRTVPEGR